tara:strand:- start:320 stop:1189 length:870 start_codon:yes stop_codon:yes gene_type:complete
MRKSQTSTRRLLTRAFGATAMIAAMVAWPATVQADAKTYSFGIVPQQAASKLARTWGPLLAHLETSTGIRLRFQTTKSIPEFERKLAEGAYDFAYMNPYHFTVFNRTPGYRAMVREANKRIQGIVVVRKDSTLQSIEGLREQTVAFPAPAAFAASVLPRAQFRSSDLQVTPKYVSSHDSVYRAVAKGLVPAGGGINRTFNKVDQTIRYQLRILWRTERYTPHAIAHHPDVADDVSNRLRQTLVALSEDETGRKFLATLGFRKFMLVRDRDWDDIRGLGIDVLSDLIAGR